jgi:hypothetical protein
VLGGDAAFDDADAFGFEEAALEAGEGLADDDTSARGDNAVPGNGLTARASGHGSAGGTSAAREAHSQGQLAVGGNASFGDALNEGVESLPSGVHVGKDSRNGRELPDRRGPDPQEEVQGLSPKSSECKCRGYGFAALTIKSRAYKANPPGPARHRALGYKEAEGLELLHKGSELPVLGV